MKKILQSIITFSILIYGCQSNPTVEVVENEEIFQLADAPTFNQDSAFAYIETQVNFGPRVPNTTEHQNTKEWLVNYLTNYADNVIEQNADLTAFDGNVLKSTNIIAEFNPEVTKRIMLSAHWDTRPFADQAKENVNTPIAGANDGASGVAVLLEIARQLSNTPVNIGVDIILFDAEDYGQPSYSKFEYMPNSYCLGSQYWAKNLHQPNYQAEFGILLDMVGAPSAVFTHEGTSVKYANNYLHKVWKIAHAAGFENYFSYIQTPPITDDHLYINEITGIPTLDIIHYDKNTHSGFGWYWHTHNDNMEAIDKNTLKAVGQTVLQTIYQENN